jgi:hypothetical protein
MVEKESIGDNLVVRSDFRSVGSGMVDSCVVAKLELLLLLRKLQSIVLGTLYIHP